MCKLRKVVLVMLFLIFTAVNAQEYLVTEKEMNDYYLFPATVNYFQIIKILPKANGFVKKWYFKEGQDVKKGDILFEIYAPEILAKYEQAKKGYAEAKEAMKAISAGIEQVKAGLELAQKTFNRIRNLYKKGSASKQQYDNALAQLKQMKGKMQELLSKKKTVELKIAQAKAGLAEAETYVSYLKVKAPYDSVVITRNVSEGDFVAPAMPMPAYILGAYPLIVEAYLPESIYDKVEVGDKVHIVSDLSKKCLNCEGTVIVKGKMVDPMSRTFKVKVQLSHKAREDVVAGMYVKLLINIGKKKGIFIPKQAVKVLGEMEFVVLKDGSIQMIRTGRTIDNMVEVLSGLKTGDVVQF